MYSSPHNIKVHSEHLVTIYPLTVRTIRSDKQYSKKPGDKVWMSKKTFFLMFVLQFNKLSSTL